MSGINPITNIIIKSLPLILLLSVLFMFSCNPTKYVPEGSYLLDKVEVKTDAPNITRNDLSDYIRQNPNSYVLGLFRMQLGIYNLSGPDTTRWFNRTWRRIGQAPVIYDSVQTNISAQQMLSYHMNRGYYNAEVNTSLDTRRKNARLNYDVIANEPYRINSYGVDVPFDGLAEIASDSTQSLIQVNDLFDIYVLNQERDRVASRMRQEGYFNFSRDMLAYRADSTDYGVELTLELRDFLIQRRDTLTKTVFKQYAVSKVIFTLTPSLSTLAGANTEYEIDTVEFENYYLVGPAKKILTLNSLVAGTFITPGTLYSDDDVERTYSSLNSLPPIKYTHISFTESATDSLDCHINIAEARSLTMTSKAELTFTEGYWGGAINLGLVNRNLFKGAESITFSGRLALEKQEDVIAEEWGGQIGVKVPRMIVPFASRDYLKRLNGSSEIRAAVNYQYRPGEFSATNVGGGLKYSWRTNQRSHNFDFMDFSYVYFPWISPEFRDSFLVTGKYNRYNYEDYMIMRMNYTGSFSNYNINRPLSHYITYRYGVESAGNLLYGLSKLFGSDEDNDGSYRLFNIRYSQYLRGEINTTYHQPIDKNNKLVYHLGLGMGFPYGNAEIIPFERRFYSGGANSVRGWSESTLGPGTYERFSSRRRDYNQVGDVKLDLNFEYRTKMFWVLEGAVFADAGNIWTIRDYENQAGGEFKFDSFWKQIAIAYGAGLRMDFNFVLFRVDMGIKLYDPTTAITGGWRVMPKWEDFAFHIAIGYPF